MVNYKARLSKQKELPGMKEMELIEYFYYNVPLSEYGTKTTGIFSEKVSQNIWQVFKKWRKSSRSYSERNNENLRDYYIFLL